MAIKVPQLDQQRQESRCLFRRQPSIPSATTAQIVDLSVAPVGANMLLFQRLNSRHERSHISALDPAEAGEQALLLVGGMLGRRFAEVAKGSFQCATLLFVQRLALRLFG